MSVTLIRIPSALWAASECGEGGKVKEESFVMPLCKLGCGRQWGREGRRWGLLTHAARRNSWCVRKGGERHTRTSPPERRANVERTCSHPRLMEGRKKKEEVIPRPCGVRGRQLGSGGALTASSRPSPPLPSHVKSNRWLMISAAACWPCVRREGGSCVSLLVFLYFVIGCV